MYKPTLLFSFICLAGCLVAQSKAGMAKIDSSAVWQVTPQFLAAAHAACDSHPGDVECLIGQMSKAGAPRAAVSFTRELYKQSHGEFGVMTGFQNHEGPVAFAWITYPLRANTNYGLLLVNGQPPIVNVEDLKMLDTKTMKQSGQFQDLKNQFPNVDVWPGDRDGKTWPNSTGFEWRNTIRGRLSADQWMPRLRTRRVRDLHMEFRCPGKVPRNNIHGNDSGATLAAMPLAGTTCTTNSPSRLLQ